MANSFSFFQVGNPIQNTAVLAITPPPAPVGYQIMGTPQALSSDHEGWWIVYALNAKFDALGMLTYNEDSQVVNFLVAQEAILTVFAMLDSLMDLAADSPASFSDDHMTEIYALWQTWSRLQSPDPAEKRLCAWCWREANPPPEKTDGNDPDVSRYTFPEHVSSKCCERHKHLVSAPKAKEIAAS